MTITLRRISLCDVEALLPLVEQLGYPTSPENLTARIALYQMSTNDIAWVAAKGDEIIGSVALHIYDLFHSTERYARIVSMIVKETYRRQGIGKLLIQKAESYAKKVNCSTLELSSSLKRFKHGAHAFYESLGYTNDGEYETLYLRKFLRPKEGPLF